jgi:hypothetical protein
MNQESNISPGVTLASDLPETARQEAAERAFGLSIALAGVRCVLKYLLLPFGLPLLGLSAEVAAPISLLIALTALVSIVWSVRGLWQLNYRWKWLYLLMGIVSIVVVIVFVVSDIQVIVAGAV